MVNNITNLVKLVYANSNNKNHGSSVHDDDDESNLLLHENGMDPLVDSLDSSGK